LVADEGRLLVATDVIDGRGTIAPNKSPAWAAMIDPVMVAA
jgi:hypothetical protein